MGSRADLLRVVTKDLLQCMIVAGLRANRRTRKGACIREVSPCWRHDRAVQETLGVHFMSPLHLRLDGIEARTCDALKLDD